MPDNNDTSSFGKAFYATCGVIVALLVGYLLLQVGCVACLVAVSSAGP